MGIKMCTACGEVKNKTEFYLRATAKDGYRNHCKRCRIRQAENYYKANPVRVKRNHYEYYRRKSRHEHLQNLYGITKERYDEMFKSQDGRCAICFETSKIDLAVDHDHKTGKIRGLLCRPCNISLGHLKDNPQILRSAIAYLTKHSAPSLQPSKEAVNA